MGNHRDLVGWQRARTAAGAIYRITERFPSAERFGLASQMRRAAVSVMANLAEGEGRQNDREFLHFARIARGSAAELESHLILAGDLELVPEEELDVLVGSVEEVRRILTGLIRHLQSVTVSRRRRSTPDSRRLTPD